MRKMLHEKLLMVLPLIISGLSIFLDKYICVSVSVVALFLCLALCEECRGHESLYCFVMLAIISIPVNIEMARLACPFMSHILIDTLLLRVFYIPMMYIAILTLEEIVIGVIGRVIWRHQDGFFD